MYLLYVYIYICITVSDVELLGAVPLVVVCLYFMPIRIYVLLSIQNDLMPVHTECRELLLYTHSLMYVLHWLKWKVNIEKWYVIYNEKLIIWYHQRVRMYMHDDGALRTYSIALSNVSTIMQTLMFALCAPQWWWLATFTLTRCNRWTINPQLDHTLTTHVWFYCVFIVNKYGFRSVLIILA